MRQRWWWNGRWGRLARRDIYLYADPWRVEARDGGADGRYFDYPVDDEDQALQLVKRFMTDGGDWREMRVG